MLFRKDFFIIRTLPCGVRPVGLDFRFGSSLASFVLVFVSLFSDCQHLINHAALYDVDSWH